MLNLFTAEKAPAILAILLAVGGFFITTVVKEIRAQPVLTFAFEERSDGRALLRLENVSLASTARDVRFEIACRDATPCLEPLGASFHEVLREPPVSPANTAAASTATEASLTATLVPGAVVTLAVRGSGLEHYYTANPEAPQALVLLEAHGLTALLVDSYVPLMAVAFVVALLGLIVVLAAPMLAALRGGASAPPPDAG